MSTYPYGWARSKQWHKLTDYAHRLATIYQSTNPKSRRTSKRPLK